MVDSVVGERDSCKARGVIGVEGVQTTRGAIAAPVVINAARPWGGLVAAMAGVSVKLTTMHHQVAVVETPEEVQWPHLTIVDRSQNSHSYVRPETGNLSLIGALHDNYPLGVDQLDTYSDRFPWKREIGFWSDSATAYPA